MGNSNNVLWFSLVSLCFYYPQVTAYLFRLDKNKVRDVPLWGSTPQINDYVITDFAQVHKFVKENIRTESESLILVSGEFHALIPSIRKLFPNVTIISFLIGFELEDLVFKRASLPQEKAKLASLIEHGIALCSYTAHLDSTTGATRAYLEKCGLWGRRTQFARQLLTLRPIVLNQILYSNMPLVTKLSNRYDGLRRIFLATRITKSSDRNSANSKGSWNLLDALANSAAFNREPILLTVPVRDSLSQDWVENLRSKVRGSNLTIEITKELSYIEFVCHLFTSSLAIDTYDPLKELRAHMATSDAVCVGTPVITAAERLSSFVMFNVAELGLLGADGLHDNSNYLTVSQSVSLRRILKRQSDLLERFSFLTDERESQELYGFFSKSRNT